MDNVDNFELIQQNINEIQNYIKGQCKCLYTYHLITDNNNIQYEIDQYKTNIINKLGTTSYIWKMHNWREF